MKSPTIPDNSRYKNPDNDPRGPYVLSDVTSPLARPSLRYEWHGQLPPEGRCWRFSEEKAQTLEAEGRITFSPTGRPRLKRYLSEANQPDKQDVEAAFSSQLELIVRTAMKAVAIAIAQNPLCLREVEWRDLERVLREVFERLGFITQLTRSGKDGGFDLQLECREVNETRIFLVEVKHWAGSGKKLGRSILSAFVNVVAKAASGATGLLLSSSGFTADILNGRTEIEQHKVRIGGQNKIVSLCQNYLQSTEGVWSPTTELADMLLVGTQ